MRAMRVCCFSPLAHLLHAAWLVSERGFNHITMSALGLQIEAPVSKWGLDYITMHALRLLIEAPFCVITRIVILMHKQSVNRDDCQCANGKCRCANDNHCLQIVFSKTENLPIMTQEKSAIVTNEWWNLVSANFGLTVRKRGLTIHKIALTMRARQASMRALFFYC